MSTQSIILKQFICYNSNLKNSETNGLGKKRVKVENPDNVDSPGKLGELLFDPQQH